MGVLAILLSMLCNCAAVEPSETLVLPDCDGAGDGLVLPVLVRDEFSPTGLAGSGLLGLSIFTMILSIYMFPLPRVVDHYIGTKTENFRAVPHLYSVCASRAQLWGLVQRFLKVRFPPPHWHVPRRSPLRLHHF